MKKIARVLLLVLIGIATTTAFADDKDKDKDKALVEFSKNQAMLQEATDAETQGKYKKAAKLFRKLGKKTQSAQLQAAYLLRQADCFFAAKKVRKTLPLYRELIERYPLYIPYDHMVQKLRALAEAFVDGNGTFLGLRDKYAAIETYELLIQGAPSIHVSLADRKRLAELLIAERRPEEAIAVFQAILKQDGNLADIRADIALLLVQMSKRGDGDGRKLRLAVRQAEMALQQSPALSRRDELTTLIAQAKETQAQTNLDLAKFYLKPSHQSISSAKRYLHDTLREYPDTQAAREAQQIVANHPLLTSPDETAAPEAK